MQETSRNRSASIHFKKPRGRSNGYYYTWRKRKQVYLSADQAEAHRKFAALIGPQARGPAPTCIFDLFDRWAAEHPQHWMYPRLKLYAKFAARVPLTVKLPANHFTRFVQWLKKATYPVRVRRGKRIVTEARPYSAFSIRECALCARRLITWAKDQEWYDFHIPPNPQLPKRERNPKDVPPEKLDKVLSSLDAKKLARAAELIRFIVATGCRPGEARMLRWEHVDMERGVCIIPPARTKTGAKTGSPKTIYLTAPANKALKARIGKNATWVFTSNRGKPYSSSGLRAILNRLGANPYALRHTFAQLALDQDVSIQVLAKLLGHSDLSMVRVYAQVRDRQAAQAAKGIRLPEGL